MKRRNFFGTVLGASAATALSGKDATADAKSLGTASFRLRPHMTEDGRLTVIALPDGAERSDVLVYRGDGTTEWAKPITLTTRGKTNG